MSIPRSVLFIALACAAFLGGFFYGYARADGGYLHLSEANVLAKRLVVKFEHTSSGVFARKDCTRTSARTATCEIDRILKPEGMVCVYHAHVSKRYSNGTYGWKATTGKGDCRIVS